MGLSGNTSTTLIAKNTEVVGDIIISGTLHIEGKLTGNVTVKEDSEAHLEVAENGNVEGEIHVPTVRINGYVKGDVFAAKHVELGAKADIDGSIHYNLIEMVRGAQVNGNLVYNGKQAKPTRSLLGAPKSDKPEKPEKAEKAEKEHSKAKSEEPAQV